MPYKDSDQRFERFFKVASQIKPDCDRIADFVGKNRPKDMESAKLICARIGFMMDQGRARVREAISLADYLDERQKNVASRLLAEVKDIYENLEKILSELRKAIQEERRKG